MRVLFWHVHGSWTTSFVQGRHDYLLPVVAGRGPEGRGRARSWEWPSAAVELTPDELADTPIDVAVVQRVEELELAAKWLGGRRLGADIPVVWLEHNIPLGPLDDARHPASEVDGAVVVHVTRTNALLWDTGSAPVRVIDHGIADPGVRWTGEHSAIAAMINEPARRRRVAGSDLLPRFADAGPVDLLGIGATDFAAAIGSPAWLGTFDLTQADAHRLIATRACYLHPYRWTSLGLALLEAMAIGMPVIALATAEVPAAVPAGCGFVSNDVDWLVSQARRLLTDHELGAELGRRARAHVLERYALDRFLTDWDELLEAM